MYIIAIKNNKTDEIREITFDGEYYDYIWEEGNYACDCNRRLFFARAKDEDEDWSSGCTETEYSIEYVKKSLT